jgi:fibronectin-binding autotransporter adhesin
LRPQFHNRKQASSRSKKILRYLQVSARDIRVFRQAGTPAKVRERAPFPRKEHQIVHYRNRLRQTSGLAMLWILSVLTGPAFGDTILWTGSYGNWTDPGSWNSGTVPNSLSTDVVIDNGAGPTLNSNINIAMLSIGQNTGLSSGLIDNSGYTLNLLQTFTNNGFVELNGGGAIAAGAIVNTGYFYLNNLGAAGMGNTVTSAGFTNAGLFSLNTSGGSADVANIGTFSSTAGGQTDVLAGSTLNLTKRLDISGGSVVVQGTFTGLDKLEYLSGGTLALVGQSYNITPDFILNPGNWNLSGGTLELDGASLTVNGNVTSGALIQSRGFYSTLNGNAGVLNVTGSFTNNSGGILLVQNGDSVSLGSLTNNGQIDVASGGSLQLTNQPGGLTTIAAGSSLTVESGGVLTANGGPAFAGLQTVNGTLSLSNNGGSFTSTPASGTLTVGPSGNLSVGNAQWTIAGKLDNQGTTTAASGALLNIQGGFTNEKGASLIVSAGSTVNAGNLNNLGLLVLNGGTLDTTNDITTIAAGSEIDLYSSIVNGGHNALAGLQTVAGNLVIGNGQLTTGPPSGTTTLTGAVNVRGGSTWTVNGNLVNNSQTGIAAGSIGLTVAGALNVTGGITNNSTMSASGSVSAGSFENYGSFESGSGSGAHTTISGAYTQASGVTAFLNAGDTLTAGRVNVDGGLFQLANVSTGVLDVEGGEFLGAAANVGGPLAATLPAVPTLNVTADGTATVNGGTLQFGTAAQAQYPTLPGAVYNAGSFSIGSAGLVETLGGVYDQSAGSTLMNGRLDANATISGGTLEGSGQIDGTLALTGTGAYVEGIFGANSDEDLTVSGQASLGGLLDIVLENGFVPQDGERFEILGANGGIAGQFSGIESQYFGFNNQDYWSVSYAPDDVTLTAHVFTPEPGTMFLMGSLLIGISLINRIKISRKNKRS